VAAYGLKGIDPLAALAYCPQRPLAMAAFDAVGIRYHDSGPDQCGVCQRGLPTRYLYSTLGLAARVQVEED